MVVMYPIIKQDIIDKINDQTYIEGTMLPTERELTETFRVSRMTVRRALDELIQDGILIRRRGSGVFVAKKKLVRSLTRVSIRSDKEIVKEYGNIFVKVVELKITKNHPKAMRLLQVSNQEEVWQLKRVQYGGNTPVVYEDMFLPVKYFKDLDQIDCTMSMKDIVEKTIRIPKPKESREIEIESVLASIKISKMLQIPKGSPVLRLNIIILDGNVPMYCGIDSYNGDTFSYISD